MLSKTLNSPPRLGGVPSKRGRWYDSRRYYPLRFARPPNLGGQYRDLDNSYIIAKIIGKMQMLRKLSFIWLAFRKLWGKNIA